MEALTQSGADRGRAPALLVVGDSSVPAMRHEIPVVVPGQMAFLDTGERRQVFCLALELPVLEAVSEQVGFSVTAFEDLGLTELVLAGQSHAEAIESAIVRGCTASGVQAVRVPAEFPLALADALRDAGIDVHADARGFADRRRSKTDAEIAGIRLAQRAAEAALQAVRETMRAGGALTAEQLRRVAYVTLAEHGAVPHDLTIIAPGPQGANLHGAGSGPIAEGVPVIVDIFPKHLESGCWGDLTRTLCVGEPPEELERFHRDVREAQRLATEAVRPGVTGEELNRIAMDCLASRGHATRHDGEVEEGFVCGLGHGVGLRIHEAPWLDHGGEALVAGDVITIEPGLYRPDFGGCRLEDLVLVTDDGYEKLTTAPYDLAP